MSPALGNPPDDHIYGDLDQPKQGVKWLRERYQGVHHCHQKEPGHPKPGEPVTLTATVSGDLPVESVYTWVTTDDWQTRTEHPLYQKDITWNTALWSYLQNWQVTLPPQPAGTMLRYKIGAKLIGTNRMVYADSQSNAPELATSYAIYYRDSCPPEWAEQAIVYQIFVDRFNAGEGKAWEDKSDLRARFGGSLQGVIEKLSYLKSIGFNAIWLTPIFASPSHHGYDISDYYQINHHFGSMDDFHALLDQAHKLGIKVILDFVANHCSNQHPFFLDALEHPDSPYRDYFVWKKWPQYKCFYNVRTMPKLNLAYGGPAREYLLKCAQFWLEQGVDGFRLDYAHGPEQDFWVDFQHACEAVNPDVWTFGEIIQPADVQATFAGGLLGALDFAVCQAVRLTFAQQKWPLSKFAAFMQNHYAYYPDGFSLPAFIDNHDMNRFLIAANGEVRLLRLALLLLYTLPGPPIVYYGTEVLLAQNRSIHEKGAQGFDEARLPLPWEREGGSNQVAYLTKLAEIRQKHPEIWQSVWTVSCFDDQDEVLFLEKQPEKNFLLIINRANEQRSIVIEDAATGGYWDLIADRHYESQNGKVTLSLQPVSAKLIFSGLG